MRHRFITAFLVSALTAGAAHARPITIVAAENFYGDISRQVGGENVVVTDILANPDQDPHEFEAGPSTARAFADANIVIYNGADYDPWAAKMLAASPAPNRAIISVAELMHKTPGDNPHLWYDPTAVSRLAATLVATLAKLDPANGAGYQSRLAAFTQSLMPLTEQVAELRRKYAGTPVTATEPVFGYMAEALGFDMRNRHFQLAVMNDTEPSAADIAAFEKDLESRAVRLLIYNARPATN